MNEPLCRSVDTSVLVRTVSASKVECSACILMLNLRTTLLISIVLVLGVFNNSGGWTLTWRNNVGISLVARFGYEPSEEMKVYCIEN